MGVVPLSTGPTTSPVVKLRFCPRLFTDFTFSDQHITRHRLVACSSFFGGNFRGSALLTDCVELVDFVLVGLTGACCCCNIHVQRSCRKFRWGFVSALHPLCRLRAMQLEQLRLPRAREKTCVFCFTGSVFLLEMKLRGVESVDGGSD